jgi:hypothetical protein
MPSPVSLGDLAGDVTTVQSRLAAIESKLDQLLKFASEQQDKTRTIEVAVFRIGRVVDSIWSEV